VPGIGVILDAINERSQENSEDTTRTKEIFQKIQVMSLFILVFLLAGSFFCFAAVSGILCI
jgi:membrane protein YqaA with SNARE-associated domain